MELDPGVGKQPVALRAHPNANDAAENAASLEHQMQPERLCQALRPENSASRCSIDRLSEEPNLSLTVAFRGQSDRRSHHAIDEAADRSPPKKKLGMQECPLRLAKRAHLRKAQSQEEQRPPANRRGHPLCRGRDDEAKPLEVFQQLGNIGAQFVGRSVGKPLPNDLAERLEACVGR